jgi:uncharacterized protein
MRNSVLGYPASALASKSPRQGPQTTRSSARRGPVSVATSPTPTRSERPARARWRRPSQWPGLVRGFTLLGRRLAQTAVVNCAVRLRFAPLTRCSGRMTEPTIVNPASDALVHLIESHAAAIGSELNRDDARAFFREAMLNTWQTTLNPQPDGSVFVITGDIPAMWLRDSSAQLRPYLLLASESEEVRRCIAGLIRKQWQQIAIDPYANAFNAEPNSASWHGADLCDNPWVWEEKYEIDSLAFPIQLAWQYWKATGDTTTLAPVHEGARAVIDLWRLEQDHQQRSSYRFVREGTDDTLGPDGRGTPVAVTGMTWSGFRPSDDACSYHYNVPAQYFAAHALGMLADLALTIWDDPALADDATSLADEIRAGIAAHAITAEGTLAYEVNGLGDEVLMDDANMPSLLSLPLCSDLTITDERYQATRSWILSDANPFYQQGSHARGIGSPHTPDGYVWPIALAVQGLTATSREEAVGLAACLLDTTGGTGLMHEGFNPDNPDEFTRPWFSWANSMVCELLLSLTGRTMEQATSAR